MYFDLVGSILGFDAAVSGYRIGISVSLWNEKFYERKDCWTVDSEVTVCFGFLRPVRYTQQEMDDEAGDESGGDESRTGNFG